MTNTANTTNAANRTNADIINSLKAQAKAARPTSNKPVKGYQFKDGKYLAQIGVGRSKIYLGSFNTPEEATAVYITAKAHLEQLRAEQV